MLRLLIIYWAVALSISATDSPTKASTTRTYGCQFLPILKTFDSQKYPGECKLTIPTFICAGFCESSAVPTKARKDSQHQGWQIHFKQDCECCVPEGMQAAFVNDWPLTCPDHQGKRTESVTFHLPHNCSCTQCRTSNRLG